MQSAPNSYDFGDARFDLEDPADREILQFMFSQALYGEATGVYCGKSLYAARSLEAAQFYVRQAKQELNHLKLFADIFRSLDMKPLKGHWVLRLLAAHNNYYPLKVLLEHALGEGMVLDIFRDVLMQTLPDDDPRVSKIKKKLKVVCMEEEEHVAWGEKETRVMLKHKPWLRWPYYGLLELQMMVVPFILVAFKDQSQKHAVLKHLPDFLAFVKARVWKQGQDLGFVPETRPGLVKRSLCMVAGALLFLRSQFARSSSSLDKIYLQELGFE